MFTTRDLKIKVYADGASIPEMTAAYEAGIAKGFTTNPSLVKQAGISNYREYGKRVLAAISDLPLFFEVLADDFDEMEKEAQEIAGWGPNVNVKIPICDSEGRSSIPLIEKLSGEGIAVTVTAVFTMEQVEAAIEAFDPKGRGQIAIYAGRIADTGRNPMPLMKKAAGIVHSHPRAELIWASTRELLNIVQAETCDCDIITVPYSLLNKISRLGRDLEGCSQEMVKLFRQDTEEAGLSL
ncbi:MAG TPA: transaldolase [Firmicutes bacterium]|nr:transaldolase [Bacillota bacterium]